MNKSKTNATQAAPSQAAPTPVALVGLERRAGGYVAVSYVVAGDRVESRVEHCPPQLLQYAARVLRTILTKKVLFPRGL